MRRQEYMLQAELGNLALTDELTCLWYRRGFNGHRRTPVENRPRTGRGILLFFLYIDGMTERTTPSALARETWQLKRVANR